VNRRIQEGSHAVITPVTARSFQQLCTEKDVDLLFG